ncbi:RHS repeat-associated core domain-containing protein [Dyella flava]|nr:RHS repeat-associated core domain-containing protein [Dyella flava]
MHDDALGRPEIITNGSGSTVWRAQNYAFDRAIVTAGIDDVDMGLPGQIYDANSGFWSNGFRDYASTDGRYLQSDPIGLRGGVNTYAYVGGNPISEIDPLGLCDQQKCTAARALLASLGQQLSSTGSAVTWTGVGLVAASGVAGILAPEGAPAEIGGAETGAGLIDAGGALSTMGETLTGYAQGGYKGAGLSFIKSVAIDHGGSFALGRLFNGVENSTLSAANSILGQVPAALSAEGAACANN